MPIVPAKKVRPPYDPVAAGCLCAYCPLRGQTVVPPTGPHDADMVIVGETPGYHEEERGEPFVGPSGRELDSILYHLRLDHGLDVLRKRLWITNTILCRPETPGVTGSKRFDFSTYLAHIRKENKDRRKAAHVGWKKGMPPPTWVPIPSPIDCCKPRLWAELSHFENVARARGEPNGIIVIPAGNYAAEAVVGKAGIMKLRGSPIAVNMADPRAHLHREPGPTT